MKKQKIIGLLMMVPLMAFILYGISIWLTTDWMMGIKVLGSVFAILIATFGFYLLMDE